MEMTRQEAIKILKAAQTDDFPYLPGKLIEAVDLAIKSLEVDEAYQLEHEYEKTKALFRKMVKEEDCISRDYTAKYVEEFANNEYVSEEEAKTIYLIADGIRNIQSAYPKNKKPIGEWIEKEHFVGCSGSAECSVCHERTSVNPHDNGFSLEYIFPKYCPNCGSLMEGGKADATLDKHNRS